MCSPCQDLSLTMFPMFCTLEVPSQDPIRSDLRIIGLSMVTILKIVDLHWNNLAVFANATKNLSSKLKQVRAGLKKWSKNLSKLSKLIYNCDWVLLLLDGLEDQRPLSNLEKSFKNLSKAIMFLSWNQREFTRDKEI